MNFIEQRRATNLQSADSGAGLAKYARLMPITYKNMLKVGEDEVVVVLGYRNIGSPMLNVPLEVVETVVTVHSPRGWIHIRVV